jgi:glyceraldehyde 3-phosphate dehydrogenase
MAGTSRCREPLGPDVGIKEGAFTVNGQAITVLAERDPATLPWQDLGVELVVESTGFFTDRDQAAKHLDAGAAGVIITAPAKNPDLNQHHIISNASCTTNCLAPVAKMLLDTFGIQHGFMTTMHAYTNDQQMLDLPHRDWRRARTAAVSLIPTTTGAATSVGLVLPPLQGKLDGLAIRVPTPNVSVMDFVAAVERDTSKAAVNEAFRKAAEGTRISTVTGPADRPILSTACYRPPTPR